MFAVAAALVILSVAYIGIGVLDTRAQASPNEVVERFYTAWADAERAQAGGATKDRLHERSTYVTQGFSTYVTREAERGRDGVLCGPVPSSVSYRSAAVSSDGTRASVDVQLDDRRTHVVLARDEKEWWRIDEIDCPPAPEAATSTDTATSSGATSTAS